MRRLLLASAGLFTVATPASAAELVFNFSAENPANSISFVLDDTVAPDAFIPNQFAYAAVPVTTSSGLVTGQIDFYNFGSPTLAGFNFASGGSFVDYVGSALFTGPTSAPQFILGSFALSGTGGTGTLTIGEVGGAVPEPTTWAMMLLGFGFVGGAMRFTKRRQKFTVSYA
ncbi:PEPxxWA-CTERM sorting domain-containing protein [Alteripontixanthobacter muriae]|uniref:PEPxxWA-CTERM sorting domain-containing protein n=1 Tax=Alteripontixanthobacter muriae TaxID=2705546 RepID=UPI001E570EA7|nr:PEPxxWA-CTERM sorting domain-containing protein [Alteripontixanthobacter muriae]